MEEDTGPVPVWRFEHRRHDHFERHRRELRVRTLQAYDDSARETIAVGTYFEFIEDDSDEPRVGYHDRWTGRLTILSDDERIIYSHFRCREQYVQELPGSTYS